MFVVLYCAGDWSDENKLWVVEIGFKFEIINRRFSQTHFWNRYWCFEASFLEINPLQSIDHLRLNIYRFLVTEILKNFPIVVRRKVVTSHTIHLLQLSDIPELVQDLSVGRRTWTDAKSKYPNVEAKPAANAADWREHWRMDSMISCFGEPQSLCLS